MTFLLLSHLSPPSLHVPHSKNTQANPKLCFQNSQNRKSWPTLAKPTLARVSVLRVWPSLANPLLPAPTPLSLGDLVPASLNTETKNSKFWPQPGPPHLDRPHKDPPPTRTTSPLPRTAPFQTAPTWTAPTGQPLFFQDHPRNLGSHPPYCPTGTALHQTASELDNPTFFQDRSHPQTALFKSHQQK